MSHTGFIVDTSRCVACKACVVACQLANPGQDHAVWRTVTSMNGLRYPGLSLVSLSVACNHCEDAPCAENCPARAYRRDPATGVMMHTEEHCIGCRYCTWVCPYDAPKFNSASGVISKCTGCQPRQAEGMKPACVEGCPTGALAWGDVGGIDAEVPGLPRTAIRPGLKVIPGRKNGQPRMAVRITPAIEAYFQDVGVVEPKKVSLNEEWTLVAFTMLAALQVAWFYAVFTERAEMSVLGFGLSALTGLMLSVMHLGRKGRAWRAILNFRRSWVSREVAGYGLFLLSAGVWMVLPWGSTPGWIALLAGFFTLWSMDMVYLRIAWQGRSFLHSAGIFSFMVFMYIGFFCGIPWLFYGVTGLRLLLYLLRAPVWRHGNRDSLRGLVIFRIGVGFILPLLLTLIDGGAWLDGIILLLFLAGDLIDRSEFYMEIEIMSPGKGTPSGWGTLSG